MERLLADFVLSGKKALLSYRCVSLGWKRLLFYFYFLFFFRVFLLRGGAVKNCKSDLWNTRGSRAWGQYDMRVVFATVALA